MQITITNPENRHHPDFHFIEPLLAQFEQLDYKESIYVPDVTGKSKEVELSITLGYPITNNYRPSATLSFVNDRLKLRQLYKVDVNSSKKIGHEFELTMKVTDSSRRGYPRTNTHHKDATCVVKTLVGRYKLGGMYRKVVALKE